MFRHKTWKVQDIYGCSADRTTAILSETFFVWFRCAREIWLESYGPRHKSVVLWHNIVCVYCKPVIAHIAIWCETIQDNKTHVPSDTKRQTMALLPTMHRFIRTKLASNLHIAMSFQSVVYANIKITNIRCTTVLIYELAAKQPKRT